MFWIVGHTPKGTRIHFLSLRGRKYIVLPPSSWRQAALIRAAFECSSPFLRAKRKADTRMGICFSGFGGNYGYNSRQQFGECTSHVNSVPPVFCCTPAQIFVSQVIKVCTKKYRESLNYLLDKFEFTSSILSCTKCVDCIWDILNDG